MRFCVVLEANGRAIDGGQCAGLDHSAQLAERDAARAIDEAVPTIEQHTHTHTHTHGDLDGEGNPVRDDDYGNSWPG